MKKFSAIWTTENWHKLLRFYDALPLLFSNEKEEVSLGSQGKWICQNKIHVVIGYGCVRACKLSQICTIHSARKINKGSHNSQVCTIHSAR
jgi:hypothetical protein